MSVQTIQLTTEFMLCGLLKFYNMAESLATHCDI